MKALISLSLAATIAVAGCSTTSVQYTDKSGNTMEIPAELYAVKMQQEYADKQIRQTCDKINEPMALPEGIELEGDSAAWAVALMSVTHNQAKEDCTDAMASIAATNKPSDYLRYKLENKKATWGMVLKTGGFLLTGACLLRVGGVCDGGVGGTSGNTYGDNWVFNQSTGGGGGAGGAGGHNGDGGLGGPFRPSNNINFGHGNVMGSDLSGSLAGMNDHLTFVNGGGTLDSSTDNSDNRSATGGAEGTSLNNQF
jgi:hypothetical protein